MVILPTEKRFDWQYAPLMMFAIVLVNVLVFFLYQSGDDDKFELALDYYHQSNLLKAEWPAYQNYLSKAGEDELLTHVRQAYEERDTGEVIYQIVGDDDFFAYLEENSNELVFDPYSLSDDWSNWDRQRSKVDGYVQSISSLSLGLIPDQMSPLTLVTYQFLHGDFMHLLGNMFFLVFCAFAVEAAIGAWFFLGLYLASGIVGGLLYAVVDLQSGIPLVGASGSISGVMAMYLGVFRLRKIEFFYWIFIFAGYFRAPALLILPLYIGKELLDFFLVSDSNVAFLAHAGGFLGGAALMLLTHHFKPAVIDHEYVEADQQVDPRQQALAEIYHMVEEVRLAAAARKIPDVIEKFGEDFELALLHFNLLSVTRQESLVDDYKASFEKLVALKPRGKRDIDRLAKAWRDNADLHEHVERDTSLKLAMMLTTVEYIALAEPIFLRFYADNANCSAQGVLARKLSITFEKLKDSTKKKHYASIADQLLGGAV